MDEKGYPIKRNLDGVYYRVDRDGKWDSVCFSDLTDEERMEFMSKLSEPGLKHLAEHLAGVLRHIGNTLDIICE